MKRRAFLRLLGLGLLGCGFAFAGCKGDGKQPQKLVIFAAASLREAFSAAAEGFKSTHPDVEVVFHFAGTQELRAQVEHGARADVFASADTASMEALVKGGFVESPVVFARNELVLVVAKDSTDMLKSFGDLPKAARVVVGAPEVPVGRYTAQMLEKATSAGTWGADFKAQVEGRIASRELNVKQVLTRVSLGEADAGVVYRTDAKAAQGVSVVEVPASVNVIASYPMAVTKEASQTALAKEWVVFVTEGEGQKALLKAGFLSP